MKPYIVCIPDTQDSYEFLKAAQKYSLPLILLIKKKWAESIEAFPWDSLIIDNLDDHEDVKKAVEDFLSQKYPHSRIVRFIAFGEANIELIGLLNSTFMTDGLKSTQAALFRDKYLMKLKAQSLGIPVPLFSTIAERADFYAALKHPSTPFKILIKPKRAWGCQGIVTFSSPEEADRYIEQLESPDEYILEEYLEASMYHVGGLVNQGKTVLSVVIKHGASLFEMGRSVKEHLILHTIDQHSKTARTFKSIHDHICEGFELKQGLTFIEFFKEHSSGNILLCEAAARHPALHVPKLYEIVTEKNIFDAYAQILSNELKGENSSLEIKPNQDFAGLVSFAALPGKLVAVDSLDKFSEDQIVYKQQSHNLLNTVFKDISFKNTIGQIMIRTCSEKECVESLNAYSANFYYRTVPG